MHELPKIEELERATANQSVSAIKDLENTENILKRLFLNIEAFKKIEQENLKLRDVLLKNHSELSSNYKNKIRRLTSALEDKELIAKNSHMSLLKQHEEIKLELNKRLAIEKQKN